MSEKVRLLGMQRQEGYLYYVDKPFGNLRRTKMARGGNGQKGMSELVYPTGIVKKPGYLYFLDRDGDISCTKARWLLRREQKGLF